MHSAMCFSLYRADDNTVSNDNWVDNYYRDNDDSRYDNIVAK